MIYYKTDWNKTNIDTEWDLVELFEVEWDPFKQYSAIYICKNHTKIIFLL